MAERNRNGRRRTNNVAKQALARGVVPIRRAVAPQSHELLQEAEDKLLTEIQGAGRIYRVDTLAVTVIGFSRFTNMMLRRGPKTSNIVNKVYSCRGPLDVKIGSLGIYGAKSVPKLAFSLHSEELDEEIAALEEAYEERTKNKGGDYALKENWSAEDGKHVPHLTIGQLWRPGVENYTDPRATSRLEAIAGVVGQTLTLSSVELPTARR